MKTLKNLSSTVLLALLLPLFAGCSGCGTLAPGGVYSGDKVLYDADFAIGSSYELLHAFVLFEYNNREALKGTPEVKQFADKVRLGARSWITSAIAVRDRYAAEPSVENRASLLNAIKTLREAVLQATRYQATIQLPEK